MLVRQVQAHEVQGHHLREVRRRGDAFARAARAHGPYRARRAGRAYLVPEVAAEPHRSLARHDAEGPRAHPLLRILRRDRVRHHAAEGAPAALRGRVPQGPGRVRQRQLHRQDRRGSDPRHAARARPAEARRRPARRDRRVDLGAQAEEARQAPQADRGVHAVAQSSRVDDLDGRAGDPAGSASARAARRRPFRHVGPQRPLPPRHQPQQPPEAADRAARARHHHPQREADAAGGGRCAVRQRPARPRHHRRQQAAAEVARRHAQGQAGPLPPEPARQARRLFGPLGDRGRARAQAAPVRPAEEDGARAVQAVHLFAARRQGPLHHGEAGQEAGREGEAGGLGHPRRGDPRASGAAQPRPDPASPRHPGVRAGADRGQGDPAASAGLRGVQRRLRRRPDGGARSAVARSAARGARADDVDQQHPASGERPADHRAVAGHRARALLPVADARQRAGAGHAVRHHVGRRACAEPEGGHAARQGQVSLGRPRRERRRGAALVRHHAGPHHSRPGAAALEEGAVRRREPPDDQARNLRDDRYRLPPLRAEGDRDLLRPHHGARLLSRVQGRHLVRQGRHGGAGARSGRSSTRPARPRRNTSSSTRTA